MNDIELDDQLRQKKQYAGGYVAWLDGKVILSAETDSELCDRLDRLPVDQSRISIEFIEPTDVVRVYSPRIHPRMSSRRLVHGPYTNGLQEE